MGDAILRGDQPLNLETPDNRLLSLVLAYQAERYPDTCFIKTEEAEISYRQMQDLVDRYSVWMHQRGIGKEDRICLLMVSCIDYVALTLAANSLGAIWIPVNTDYKGDWLHGTLVNSAPKITVVSPEFVSRLDDLGALDTEVVSTQALPSERSNDRPPPQPDLYYGDTVSVMWTSGTTGNAKGVMQSHNTWIRSALSAVYMGGMKHGDTTLNVLPLHNSAAWVSNIYPALLTGATCVLVKSFSAGGFWQQVREYEVSHTLTLGAMHML